MEFNSYNADEFLSQCGDKKELVNQLCFVIKKYFINIFWIYNASEVSMIGFGAIEYKGKDYPIVGVSPQKNYVTIHIIDHEFLAQFSWKKIKTGAGCLKIKSLNPEDMDYVIELMSLIKKKHLH
ncbi:MAG: hypothetical protein ACRCTJ_06170 [Brevinema sp.]